MTTLSTSTQVAGLQFLGRKLATGPADSRPEVLTEYVAASNEQSAIRAAKLALIARGRTPDYPVLTEDQGDGTWEIGFTDRPLRPDQSFLADTGQRVSLVGGSRKGRP